MTTLLRSCRRIQNAGITRLEKVAFELPLFLCPALTRPFRRLQSPISYRPTQNLVRKLHCRQLNTATEERATDFSLPARLPVSCSGCGALSQTVDPESPGYYSVSRKAVKSYLSVETDDNKRRRAEDDVVKAALENLDETAKKSLGIITDAAEPPSTVARKAPPICDRCHELVHYRRGNSIQHPSIESLRDTMEESPHKHNHIYHVIDAADFPMSLIKGVHRRLGVSEQRSYNRRSKVTRFSGGKERDITFVITRSDLLAPTKELVDSKMPYLTQVLRDALGSAGKNVRLGNVRCVSARRNWWTKELKEDIWERGGGGWMVGKVNVGKSRLFEHVFPKGRSDAQLLPQSRDKLSKFDQETLHPLHTSSLLPPAQVETNYPEMPIVSDLPGTTASPIRVPYGSGKGELIDLPGLSRGDLELYVKEEHRSSLIMKSRIEPEQQVMKPGKSLLLGGLIRITPTTPDLIFLSYAFTPISPHLTATEKAIEIQTGQGTRAVESIALPTAQASMASAGVFPLKWDVTKERAGLNKEHKRKRLAGINLPYKVLGVDILIEGCGWVEIVAQVRTKWLEQRATETRTLGDLAPESEETSSSVVPDSLLQKPAKDRESTWARLDEESKSLETRKDLKSQDVIVTDDSVWPAVEVFSPEGKFVTARRPMNAWMAYANFSKKTKGRPRQSKKGEKKKLKMASRAAKAA